MNIAEAIILGIVQGLTEFLPVSSSAHLVFAQSLIPGFRQPGVLFDVILHVGTLAAVVFFLRKNITALTSSLLRHPARTVVGGSDTARVRADRKTILLIILATACTGAIGLPFKSRVEELFQSVETAALMLLITGLLLFLAGRINKGKREEGELTVADGILIGIAQGIAIMPGISRSGATITAGIFRKMAPDAAARFSFLLSIPAIAGAAILEARHFSGATPHDLTIYAAGFLAALVAGFASLKLLFKILNDAGLKFFAYYCWALGLAVLAMRLL